MDNNTKRPTGLFIQENDKGQYVYKDMFVKGGYIISNDKAKKYGVYSLRYVIALITALLVDSFINNVLPSLIVGIFVAIVGEILFRVKFLPSCTYLPNYVKKKEESFLTTIIKNTPTSKKIIKIVLFLALAVLIVVNGIQQNYPIYGMVMCYIVSAASLVMCVIHVIALIKEGGNK